MSDKMSDKAFAPSSPVVASRQILPILAMRIPAGVLFPFWINQDALINHSSTTLACNLEGMNLASWFSDGDGQPLHMLQNWAPDTAQNDPPGRVPGTIINLAQIILQVDCDLGTVIIKALVKFYKHAKQVVPDKALGLS